MKHLITLLYLRVLFPVSLSAEEMHVVYVPKNLEECFAELQKFLTPAQLNEFKNVKEEEVIARYHKTLGMWIRRQWGLWSESRLTEYFNGLGISQPDDMYYIILTAFHRKLNNEDIKLEEQIKEYQTYREDRKKRIQQLGKDDAALLKESIDANSKESSEPPLVIPEVKDISDTIITRAIEILENSEEILASCIGRGCVCPKENWAFNIILRSKRRIEIFNRLLENENPVCKSYGICGLSIVSENDFKKGRIKYLQLPSALEVSVSVGCIVGYRFSPEEFLKCVELGYLRRVMVLKNKNVSLKYSKYPW